MNIRSTSSQSLIRRSTSSLSEELSRQSVPQTASSRRTSATDLQALGKADQMHVLERLEHDGTGITITVDHQPQKQSLLQAVQEQHALGAHSVTIAAKMPPGHTLSGAESRGGEVRYKTSLNGSAPKRAAAANAPQRTYSFADLGISILEK